MFVPLRGVPFPEGTPPSFGDIMYRGTNLTESERESLSTAERRLWCLWLEYTINGGHRWRHWFISQAELNGWRSVFAPFAHDFVSGCSVIGSVN